MVTFKSECEALGWRNIYPSFLGMVAYIADEGALY